MRCQRADRLWRVQIGSGEQSLIVRLARRCRVWRRSLSAFVEISTVTRCRAKQSAVSIQNRKPNRSTTLRNLSSFIASGNENALRPGRLLKSGVESSKPLGEHHAIRLGFCRCATCSKSLPANQACRHRHTEVPPAEHAHTRNRERSLNAFEPHQTDSRGADRRQCAAISTH